MPRYSQTEHLPVAVPKSYTNASRWLFDVPYLNRRKIFVSGLENLPLGSAPYILASGHRSLLDIPVLGHMLLEHDGTQIHFVAKKELWESHESIARIIRRAKVGSYISTLVGNWLGDGFADYFTRTSAIPYDRSQKVQQQPDVVSRMNWVLQNNGVLGMFPEHTRRKGPMLQIEKRGLGMLAVANAVPIATVGIYGTEQLRGPIYVNVGQTSYPGPLGDERSRRQRFVGMEAEYSDYLQEAIFGAYRLAGRDDLLPESV